MISIIAKGHIDTPNKTKRTETIDSFSIHHMACKMSGKRCAKSFAKTSRKASANYCIGEDGAWASAAEEYRAWTSSTGNVPNGDQRVITIELANDKCAPTWHVSDNVIETCIQLMVDICKRYNIKEVKWSNDKNIRKSKGYMYMHKDWAATTCPGPYLERMIPEYIIPEVNKRLKINEGLFISNKEDNIIYKVQIGAFKDKQNAEDLVKALKYDGFNSIIIEEKINK